MKSTTEESLRIITSYIKADIGEYDIVLPSLYKDMFCEKAREANVVFQDSIEEAVSLASKKLLKIEEGVSKHATLLDENLGDAQKAIEAQDLEQIQHIKKRIESLKTALSTLRKELYKDELTLIYNRKWLFQSFLCNERFKSEGILAFIDLNDFKKINDQFGHLVGDKVLRFFASRLDHFDDVSAVRYAGDEFLMLFKNTSITEVEKRLQHFAHELEHKHFKVGEDDFKITFSYGLTTFHVDDLLDHVLDHADKAMYKDKARA